MLQIADCDDRIRLEFGLRDGGGAPELAAQARHADHGPACLSHPGLIEEFAQYERRERELAEQKGE
jgi:hypothetical protein